MQLRFTPPEVTSNTSPDIIGSATVAADRVGMVGSLICAVHCALMPLVLSVLPALGIGLMGRVDLDQAFVIFATLLGIATLSMGYRRHRAHRAWALLVPGLALVWLGSFGPLHDHSTSHAITMTVGGLLIAAAHLLNLRLSHQSALATLRPLPSPDLV